MPEDLDGCDLDFTVHPLTEEEQELFPLFADALDFNTSKTIADVEREWGVK